MAQDLEQLTAQTEDAALGVDVADVSCLGGWRTSPFEEVREGGYCFEREFSIGREMAVLLGELCLC